MNHTGDKAKTQMLGALTIQTGPAEAGHRQGAEGHPGRARVRSTYTISSAGGDVSLKYFGARETRAGVSAAPWGHRQVFAGTFMKGGRFPEPRHGSAKLHGQVMHARLARSRLPLEKEKSGLYIPQEMVTGATADAFRMVAERDLPDQAGARAAPRHWRLSKLRCWPASRYGSRRRE